MVGNRYDKLVCYNCGSSMVPADSLNVPSGSRIGMSAAFSELNFPRESLASMFEDNVSFVQQPLPGTPVTRQALAAISNAKSTEDLYIDDDFCQGLGLGANMELVEFIDDGHYLDEYGYDIYTTEEIYDSVEENSAEPEEKQMGETEPGQQEEGEQQFLAKCADWTSCNIDVVLPADAGERTNPEPAPDAATEGEPVVVEPE